MARLRESFNSREITDDKKGGRKLTYRALITGAADEQEAEDCALAEMPDVVVSGGVPPTRQSYQLPHEGAGVYRLEAQYAEDDEPQQNNDGGEENQQPPPTQQNENEALGPEWNIQVSEAQVHITQSLATQATYNRAPIANAPVTKKIIGLRPGQGIMGCDIVGPKETRSLTVKVAGMSHAYLKSLKKLFRHTNKEAIMGCEVGEVLYVGYTTQYRAGQLWALTHNFWIGENLVWDANNPEMVKQLTIGDIQLTGGKKAWDYVWIYYDESPDVVAGVMVEIPRHVFVEQVYPEGNLKLLGV